MTDKHLFKVNLWKVLYNTSLAEALDFDETSKLPDVEAAAKMAALTFTVITLKHYLINEEERKMEKLRKVGNGFA